jgi:hypothetical protein
VDDSTVKTERALIIMYCTLCNIIYNVIMYSSNCIHHDDMHDAYLDNYLSNTVMQCHGIVIINMR